MRTLLLVLPLVIAATLASAPASAQKIYKWKDAKGVSHYSQQPPASGDYTVQDSPRSPLTSGTQADTATKTSSGTVSSADGSSTSSTGATAQAEPDARCDSARKNLASLQSENPVLIDSDRDGKADKPLNDTERGNQLELTRATLKAYNCAES